MKQAVAGDVLERWRTAASITHPHAFLLSDRRVTAPVE
jgi:hypothetical protein